MTTNPKTSNQSRAIRIIAIAILSFLNSIAVGTIMSNSDTTYYYLGTEKYGCNLLCVAAFALCCILLNRFLKNEVLKDKGRLILSGVIGILIGLSSVWGTYMLYGTNQLFDQPGKIAATFFVTLGLAIFTVPMVSELVGFCNRMQETATPKNVTASETVSTQECIQADTNVGTQACTQTDTNVDIRVNNPAVTISKRISYFIFIWILGFLSFIPMFLYAWPINFAYDASYEVLNYVYDNITTHHPILHTLLLGWCYRFGMRNGDVNSGIQIYSLIQMAALSGAFAFLSEYLYEKGVKRALRIIVIALMLLNPLNGFFAITTAKETLCAVFTILGIVFLMRFLDINRDNQHSTSDANQAAKSTAAVSMPGIANDNKVTSTKITPGVVITAILFVICFVLSSLFRNNMIYAVIIGGVVIALLRKGWKNKLIFFIMIICIAVGYKASNKVLIKATDAIEKDTMRETLSLPLNCLARAVIYDGDKLGQETIDEIYAYIPASTFGSYNCFLADGVKNNANEDLLETNKANFFKLFIKVGLKCPDRYLESLIGTTIGYWYPLDYPYWISGTTTINYMGLDGELPEVYRENKLPLGSKIYDYMYIDNNDRLNVPLFGWLWRGTLYTWLFLFAFGYFIYRRDTKKLAIILIPLMYLASCFLGPVSFLRYIYINIALLPLVVYLLVGKKAK